MRVRLGALGVIAALAGVGAASALPAAASSSGITLQGFAVPSAFGDAVPQPGMIVPGLGGQEWFTTWDGSSTYGLAQADAGGVTQVNSGLAQGSSYPSAINGPDGFVWLLGDGGNNLSAINSGGGQTVAGPTQNDDKDLVEGPDGDLYATDNSNGGSIDQYAVSNDPYQTASPVTQFPISTSPVSPDAIASAGGKLWFSADGGDLYSMTTGGTVAGPGTPGVSDGAHTLTTTPDGTLWAVSYGTSGYGNSLLELNPSTGAVTATYSAPAGTSITSVTVGADGDLWFPEASSNASLQGVGRLDPATGQLTTYPLPSGIALPTPTARFGYDIAPGSGYTVWFTAEISGGNAAVVEVSGLLSPPGTTSTTTPTTSVPAGKVTIAASANVSRKRVASVKLSCRGASGARCAGRLTLALVVRHKVKRRGRTVTVTKTTVLGSAPYGIGAGRSEVVGVRLTKAALVMLDAAKGHKLAVQGTAKPASGAATRRSLKLFGPKPAPTPKARHS